MEVIVVKAGGQVGGAEAAAVVDLVRALRAAGHRVVLVHGGGDAISRWQQRLGLPVRFEAGRRVTDPAAMEVTEMVLTGRVNRSWVAALQRAGLAAVGVSGRDGGLITGEPYRPGGVDLGRAGRVVRVDPRLLHLLLDTGYVPVVSPVSQDAAGEPLNINGDDAAAALAAALGARLLLLLTDVPGLLEDPGDRSTVVVRLHPAEVRARLAADGVRGGMRPKLEAALAALEGGVRRVQIVDGTDPAVLAAVAEALAAGGDPAAAELPGTGLEPDEAGPPAPAGDGAGPRTADWIARGERVLLPTYARLPVAPVAGRGATLVDADGREWLDFVGGLAVVSLGHGHGRLARRIAAQAERLLHVSNLFWIPEQVELAERLARLSGMERWFFCNSGAEANEAAIKLARRYGVRVRGPQAYEIVVATGSFHGRTCGALAATGQEKYRRDFGPLLPGFRYVPFGDLEAVAAAVDERTCAVMVEPIQGESGVHVPPPGYLEGLRRLCDRHGLLLILDEVQTGIGRTGRWFAYQHEGILPDVLTLAKALGGGVAIGACGARGKAAEVLGPGDHASTFGGNPLACAAALETLAVIEEEGLVERAARLGARLLEGLRADLGDNPLVVEVRGRGLMIGIALREGAVAAAAQCRARGLLVNAIGDAVLRLLPPLTVREAEAERARAILRESLAAVAASRGLAATGAQEVGR